MILAAALAAAASLPAQAEVARPGFLDGSEQLQPKSALPGSSDWVKADVPSGTASGILIDPVATRLGNGLIEEGAQPPAAAPNAVLDCPRCSDSLTFMAVGASIQSAAGGFVVGGEAGELPITLKHSQAVPDGRVVKTADSMADNQTRQSRSQTRQENQS
jgi:hypothetical protein